MEVILRRQEHSDDGTAGVLMVGGVEWCFTLELPWEDNKVGVSCIPCGKYSVRRRKSAKYGDVYEVQQVPGRTGILIHAGNFAGSLKKGKLSDVEGCILLGMKRGILNGQRVVLNSRVAVKGFMKLMDGKEFTLTVEATICGQH